MFASSKKPLGVELLRRGLITEIDIDKAIAYQKEHPKIKLGEILYILNICKPQSLLDVIAEITGEKTIFLTKEVIKIDYTKYLDIEYITKNRVLPFDIENNIVKLAIANPEDTQIVDHVREKFYDHGYEIELYATFSGLITDMINNSKDVVKEYDGIADIQTTIDNIIHECVGNRASHIHFECLKDGIVIKMRVDGEIYLHSKINNEFKEEALNYFEGLKKIDGYNIIINEASYNIFITSQDTVYGQKVLLKVLNNELDVEDYNKISSKIIPHIDNELLSKDKGIAIIASTIYSGKTNTLNYIMSKCNSNLVNKTIISEQLEIFNNDVNHVVTDDIMHALDVEEHFDTDVLGIDVSVNEDIMHKLFSLSKNGKTIITTMCSNDVFDILDTLRNYGISDYAIASNLKIIISQKLVKKLCVCSQEKEFNEKEIEIINKYIQNPIDIKNCKTNEKVGCKLCNEKGYFGKTAIFDILVIDEVIKEMILNSEPTIKIKEYVHRNYKNVEKFNAIQEVLNKKTNFEQIFSAINFENNL